MEKEINTVDDSMQSDKKYIAIEALKEIIDPELAINIYDLGLIRKISIEDEGINILMTLTTPLCPFADIIMQDVETGLLLAGFSPVKVDFTFSPPWEMPPDIKLMFNL